MCVCVCISKYLFLETLMNHSDTQPPLTIIQRVVQSMRICSIRIQDIRPKAPPSSGNNRNGNMWKSVSLLFSSSWESMLPAGGHEGFLKNIEATNIPNSEVLVDTLRNEGPNSLVLLIEEKQNLLLCPLH